MDRPVPALHVCANRRHDDPRGGGGCFWCRAASVLASVCYLLLSESPFLHPTHHTQHLARDGTVRMFILRVQQIMTPDGRPGVLRVGARAPHSCPSAWPNDYGYPSSLGKGRRRVAEHPLVFPSSPLTTRVPLSSTTRTPQRVELMPASRHVADSQPLQLHKYPWTAARARTPSALPPSPASQPDGALLVPGPLPLENPPAAAKLHSARPASAFPPLAGLPGGTAAPSATAAVAPMGICGEAFPVEEAVAVSLFTPSVSAPQMAVLISHRAEAAVADRGCLSKGGTGFVTAGPATPLSPFSEWAHRAESETETAVWTPGSGEREDGRRSPPFVVAGPLGSMSPISTMLHDEFMPPHAP